MDYLGKWTPILILGESVYPCLVCLFYANLIILDQPFRIQSKVKGVDIEFGSFTFHDIFGIPKNNGFEIQILESQSWSLKIPNSEPITAIRALTHDPNFHEYMPSEKDFDILTCILHFTIYHGFFFLKSRSFDHVSYYEFEILWCIVNHLPIDMPYVMGHHIHFFIPKEQLLRMV